LIIERTARLTLVAGNTELIAAELNDRTTFAAILGAAIPKNWPTEILKDALPIFQGLYREHPDWEGWLHWYALLSGKGVPILCASIGFKGPPDDTGTVEIGYSVLPDYQRMSIASEMLTCILQRAIHNNSVKSIIAETEHDNFASKRVLEKNGFIEDGKGSEANIIRFRYPLL
jgi:[ribosomal protein S5]-alanine N-acetyltransferase